MTKGGKGREGGWREWEEGDRKSERGRKMRKGGKRREERAHRRFLKGTFCAASSLKGPPVRRPGKASQSPLLFGFSPSWSVCLTSLTLRCAHPNVGQNCLPLLCQGNELSERPGKFVLLRGNGTSRPSATQGEAEGHSTLCRLPVPSSTLLSDQGVTHRSGVWILRGPQNTVYLASLISLSLLAHSVSPQDLHSEVFRGYD